MRVVLVIACLAGCGGGSTPKPDAAPDARAIRTCTQALTQTMVNQPPCKWEWTCSDYSGTVPQYSIDCVAGAGTSVSCQCRDAGAVTGSITITDGCQTIAQACMAANAACGFPVAISCPF